MEKNYIGSIALSRLKHVVTSMTGKSGQPVKGIFIPFDANYIERIPNGEYHLSVRIRTREELDQYDQSGFIAHSTPTNVYNKMSKEEQAALKLPFLGNIRDTSTFARNNPIQELQGSPEPKPRRRRQ
jgi:hypothetical protein